VNGRKVAVGQICVPRRGDRYSGMVTVAGWGKSEERNKEPSLRFVHVKLLNISHCGMYGNQLLRKAAIPQPIKVPGDDEPQLCGGYPGGVKDSCTVSFTKFRSCIILVNVITSTLMESLKSFNPIYET